MTKKDADVKIRQTADVFANATASTTAIPMQFIRESQNDNAWRNSLTDAQKSWLAATGFEGKPGAHALLPDADGGIDRVAFDIGSGRDGLPCGPSTALLGSLARDLPGNVYALEGEAALNPQSYIAWGIGGYRFIPYFTDKAVATKKLPRITVPDSADPALVRTVVEGVWFGRDLINTPASDLGPDQIEAAVRVLADHHEAKLNIVRGEDLLTQNFPLIHAVGRASTQAPRLIELTWSPKTKTDTATKLTVIGKGISFDTGGLDLKSAANMRLMKKDMGGAATAIALAHMIMGQDLNIELRLLIAAAENSVAGNAFRPGDIITSRSGKTVEIGNTDAEGRLVLADALSYADEQGPDRIITCATLTGAARVALGPDLPAMFSTDDDLAERIYKTGLEIGDPVWRMPFWPGYMTSLKSRVADLENVGNTPFAGAITAALFLKSFVIKTRQYVHLDLYGWQPAQQPLCPLGGEVQSARALFYTLREELTS